MAESKFVYVTYIRSTPEKVWQALTDPAFIRRYWFGMTQESDWKPGAAWKMLFTDGRVADAGEVVEFDPPKRYVLKWRNEWNPEFAAEGYTQMTCTLERVKDQVKVSILHEIPVENSKFLGGVSNGWPMVLSSLKSLLETGEPLTDPRPAPPH